MGTKTSREGGPCLKCPFCLTEDSKVVDSRPTDEGMVIRRRRECNRCAKRFTTYEKIESLPMMVVKKDGRREAFNSNKIMAGLLKACEKRPVSVRDLEAMVQEIEKQVYNSLEREVTSGFIGEMVMEKLRELDEVAYVRFASVYRQFKDINTFMEELNKLLNDQ
jgi:transcriptional repressor NrdR